VAMRFLERQRPGELRWTLIARPTRMLDCHKTDSLQQDA
jgi:hypothetical protein